MLENAIKLCYRSIGIFEVKAEEDRKLPSVWTLKFYI